MRHLTDFEIQTYLDCDDLANNQRIEEHLSYCSVCFQTIESYKRLFGVLPKVCETELDESFTDRALSRVGVADEKNAVRRTSIWAATFGILVSVLATLSFLEILPVGRILTRIYAFAGVLLTSTTGFLSKISNTLNISTELIAFVAVVFLLFEFLDQRLLHFRRLP